MNKSLSSTLPKVPHPAVSSHHPGHAAGRHPETGPTSPASAEPGTAAAPPVNPAALDLHPVRFGYFQPDAREVFLSGSFNGWLPRGTRMNRDSFGDWSIELSLPPGEHRYRFVVDGQWREDPLAEQLAPNPFGTYDAVVVV